jgi:transcriptional regulator with XRE-family HTH domain
MRTRVVQLPELTKRARREEVTDVMTIHEWLRDQIARAGISQRELARGINAEYSQVSKWCNGHMRPSATSCRAIAEYFGVEAAPVQILAGWLPDDTPPPTAAELAGDPERQVVVNLALRVIEDSDRAQWKTLQGLLRGFAEATNLELGAPESQGREPRSRPQRSTGKRPQNSSDSGTKRGELVSL